MPDNFFLSIYFPSSAFTIFASLYYRKDLSHFHPSLNGWLVLLVSMSYLCLRDRRIYVILTSLQP